MFLYGSQAWLCFSGLTQGMQDQSPSLDALPNLPQDWTYRRCRADSPSVEAGCHPAQNAKHQGPAENQGVQGSEAEQAERLPGGGSRPARGGGAQTFHYLGRQARAEAPDGPVQLLSTPDRAPPHT